MEDAKTRSSGLLLAGKLLLGLGLVVLIAVLVAGLRSQPATTPAFQAAPATQPTLAEQESMSPMEQAEDAGGYLIVRAAVDGVTVHTRPSRQAQVVEQFPLEDQFKMPTTFLVLGEGEGDDGSDWFHVRVAMRPNGTTGWIKASDVEAKILKRSVRISLSNHALELYEGNTLLNTYPVALGTADNPTPKGEYFYSTKFRPTEPQGTYGVLAIGISAFSETLTDWPDDGQVGIHGTNQPELIGKNVSHGCIRMRNEDIVQLSKVTPVGTRVVIVD